VQLTRERRLVHGPLTGHRAEAIRRPVLTLERGTPLL